MNLETSKCLKTLERYMTNAVLGIDDPIFRELEINTQRTLLNWLFYRPVPRQFHWFFTTLRPENSP